MNQMWILNAFSVQEFNKYQFVKEFIQEREKRKQLLTVDTKTIRRKERNKLRNLARKYNRSVIYKQPAVNKIKKRGMSYNIKPPDARKQKNKEKSKSYYFWKKGQLL